MTITARVLGALLCLGSIQGAAAASIEFTEQTMSQHQQGLVLEVPSEHLTEKQHLELSMVLHGSKQVTDLSKAQCQRQSECGAHNPTQPQLLKAFEAKLSVFCDDQKLVQTVEHDTEFTNEAGASTDARIGFQQSIFRRNLSDCLSLQVHVALSKGESIQSVTGSYITSNSTSN